ncbi:MAG: aminodeoxychorismate lyase [Legionellales bacterium]|nr:aminodeoxychorismate lyase [Legionellales bacterium]HBH10863.1 endolytic transglycosylase MltG [Gammaproteobacteria bacterium]|tara:strand:- start:92 stop:1084 length:993 start_codon:yes stop_codon:yes gene_type:complete
MRLHIKFIAVIFIVTLVSICLDYKRFLDTPLNINTSLIFTIDSGSSFKDLNKKLKSYHILDKPYYFEFYARYSGYAKKIQSGEYQLSPGLTPIKIINIFVSGDVIQHSITLLEGWTIKDIKKEISSNTVLIKNLTDYSSDSLLKKIKITESNVEGLFFPDTYYFTKGASDIELLQRAYRRGKAILEKEWESRDAGLPYKNDYDALIMASIIEKETALASERAMIAGVFVRRLKNNMKLQTDPTVIYAMGIKYDGNIRKKDLRIDSPYNTYRYNGLPPTPIALAGREAIHAALHPENDDTLYFVSKKDGSHYFSKTLYEHNKAVKKYQLNK